MADDDVLGMIMKAAHASEGVEIRHFQVSGGSGPIIDVRLMDAGPDAGTLRYHVEAYETDDDGIVMSDTYTSSNPAATIESAIAGVHWQNFENRHG